ncbi:MAG: helix-turn-helix transcriptional regulator [Eubacteriales bacterium]
MKSELQPIGKKIRQYREDADLSQEKLAEQIGRSKNYISEIERDIKTPSVSTFVDICNILNVSADSLLEDVLRCGYVTRASVLSDMMGTVTPKKREQILSIVEILLEDKEV